MILPFVFLSLRIGSDRKVFLSRSMRQDTWRTFRQKGGTICVDFRGRDHYELFLWPPSILRSLRQIWTMRWTTRWIFQTLVDLIDVSLHILYYDTTGSLRASPSPFGWTGSLRVWMGECLLAPRLVRDFEWRGYGCFLFLSFLFPD